MCHARRGPTIASHIHSLHPYSYTDSISPSQDLLNRPPQKQHKHDVQPIIPISHCYYSSIINTNKRNTKQNIHNKPRPPSTNSQICFPIKNIKNSPQRKEEKMNPTPCPPAKPTFTKLISFKQPPSPRPLSSIPLKPPSSFPQPASQPRSPAQ